MTTPSTTPVHCTACSIALPTHARFCPGCGLGVEAPVHTRNVTPLRVVATLALGMLVWAGAWNAQKILAGERPMKEFQAASAPQGVPGGHSVKAVDYNDPQLERLRASAKESPNNLDVQKALAQALLSKVEASNEPPQALIMEIIKSLGEILRIDPQDKRALLTMADISFNQQVFEKAESFYRRYLEVAPDDLKARARYGSTLTFNSKFDDAERELRGVLAKETNSFEAAAYLSITLAQKGDRDGALQIGDQALKLAPNDEARTRFEEFLGSIKNPSAAQGSSAPLARDTEQGGSLPDSVRVGGANSRDGGQPKSEVVEYIKSHPIAGPKLISATSDGRTLSLTFKDFPMGAMPPFVKERFLNSIKEKASSAPEESLVFIDQVSGEEMERLVLTKTK